MANPPSEERRQRVEARRLEAIGEISRVIHTRAGHINDVEGEVGGCYRAAEEIFDRVVRSLLDDVL